MQGLFDIVAKGKMGFRLKGLTTIVKPTDAVVKADRTLTLFMLNTLADNARKFTPSGGTVTIEAEGYASYVEISISDTGIGMSEEQMAHIFDHKPISDTQDNIQEGKSHGFGLMNCKGIIEKYKKISQVFAPCAIGAESRGTEAASGSACPAASSACSLCCLPWAMATRPMPTNSSAEEPALC